MTTAQPSTHALSNDAAFESLKEYVIQATGLVFYVHRSGELARHVVRRLELLGLGDCQSYLRLLRSGADGERELDCLIEVLTIGETYFFRHREVFEALRSTVLPEVIERNRPLRRLRIWSAGCSIGAEAYSLSVLLRTHFARPLRDWEVTILGTDINRDFLARAASGQFDDWALRSISHREKAECFTRHRNRWTIRPRFKQGVSFQYHNLATHPFPSLLHNIFAFDVVLCRNVMIYFDTEVIRGAIDKFHDCLADGGWLLVGHAEHNSDWFGGFRKVMAQGALLYQKSDEPEEFTSSGGAPRPVQAVVPLPAEPVSLGDTPQFAARQSRPRDEVARPARRGGAPSRCRDSSPPALQSSAELQQIQCLADQGQLEEARQRCQRLLQTTRLHPGAHFYHALILEQLGQSKEAERSLKRAIYLDRTYLLPHYYLGVSLQKQGNAGRAIRSFENVLALLSQKESDEQVPDADDLTVSDLENLTRSHLAALEE